jgi:Tfp pilus assembly protein PilN
MRAVNLIPAGQRQGAQAPTRTGALPYLVVGVLVAALAGITLLVITSNEISERKDEAAKLQREDAIAQAKAKRLSAYTQFRNLREQRVATVSSLADSRFDWERVMRELSLVLPSYVWLTELNATASAEASGGEGGGTMRGKIAGPALELTGCAVGQYGVAAFVTVLKDIDGVTRVGVESSELPTANGGAGTGGESESGSSDCRTHMNISKFEIVVAFDAAPVPVGQGGESEVSSPTATEDAQTTSSETSSEESSSEESSEGGEG